MSTSILSLLFYFSNIEPFCSIIGITTYSAILSSPDAQRDEFRTNRPLKLNSGSSWFMSILKMFGFFGIVAALLYAYKTYALRQATGKGFNIGKGASMGGGLYADSKRF